MTKTRLSRTGLGQFAAINPYDQLMSNIKKDAVTGCWNWTGNFFEKGYGQFKNKALGTITASRAAWIIHHGQIPSDAFVLHKCDNRRCCNPDHLFLGTQKANMMDCSQKARINRGEDRPQSKLTEEDVCLARKMRREEQTPWRKLAAKFNVTLNCIVSAVTGAGWAHVTAEPPVNIKIRPGRRTKSMGPPGNGS